MDLSTVVEFAEVELGKCRHCVRYLFRQANELRYGFLSIFRPMALRKHFHAQVY